MDISIFFGKFFGIYLIVAGLFYIVKRDVLPRITGEFFKSDGLTVMSGIIAFLLGLAIVIPHNIWTLDWRLLITIIGYLSIIKGLMRLFIPEKGKAVAIRMVSGNSPIIIGLISLVLGAFLIIMTFETTLPKMLYQ